MHCIFFWSLWLHQLYVCVDKRTKTNSPLPDSVAGRGPALVLHVGGGWILLSRSPSFISWTDGTQVASTTPQPTSHRHTIRHAHTQTQTPCCKHIHTHTASPQPKLCNAKRMKLASALKKKYISI